MSITINDPALIEQLKATNGHIDIRDPSGDLLGTFQTPFAKPKAGYVAPITDEELVTLRRETTGRSLTEIIRDLRATS